MPSIVIFREPEAEYISSQIRSDLASRDWSVRVESFAGRISASVDPIVLAIVPEDVSYHSVVFPRIAQLSQSSENIIVVLPVGVRLPDEMYDGRLRGVVSSGAEPYDRVFEDIFRSLVGDVPDWLDMRIRPSQIFRPTGVTWWTEDVFVADERYEHVVRIGPNDSTVILPGLFEPHHIHLDRRTLFVANKSANEVLTCQLTDDMATDVQSVTKALDIGLAKPHDVQSRHFRIAIADTDNQRILVANSSNSLSSPKWIAMQPSKPFSGPCGLYVEATGLWIADTFNHRLVHFNAEGNQDLEWGNRGTQQGEFSYPVGVHVYKHFLLVAEEENERVQVLRIERDEAENSLSLSSVGFLAENWIGQPFGISINRENRLAVADRKQKCVWIINLPEALEAGSGLSSL